MNWEYLEASVIAMLWEVLGEDDNKETKKLEEVIKHSFLTTMHSWVWRSLIWGYKWVDESILEINDQVAVQHVNGYENEMVEIITAEKEDVKMVHNEGLMGTKPALKYVKQQEECDLVARNSKQWANNLQLTVLSNKFKI